MNALKTLKLAGLFGSLSVLGISLTTLDAITSRQDPDAAQSVGSTIREGLLVAESLTLVVSFSILYAGASARKPEIYTPSS